MINILNLPLGWLSPTGEFINCKLGDHISVAQALRKVIDNTQDTNSSASCDDQLLNFGWVHISINCLGKKEYSIYWHHLHHLTSEQFLFLEKYFENRDMVSPNSLICWDKECDLI